MLKALKQNGRICLYALFAIMILLRIVSDNSNFNSAINKINSLDKQKIQTLTVIITDIPKYDSHSVSFTAKIKDGLNIPYKIRISIKNGEKTKFAFSDTVRLKGNIQAANNASNFGTFNYKNYLRSQQICGVIYTDTKHIVKIKHGFLHKFYETRGNLSQKLFSYLPYDEASLVNALVTGSKTELRTEVGDSLKRAGIYHIAAISGLHLNILMLLISFLYMRLSISRKFKITLVLICNLTISVFVFLFTGLGVSVERAALMSLILSMSAFAMREYSPFSALTAVLFGLILVNPKIYENSSMQLSFSATYGILAGTYIIKKYKINEKKANYIYENLITSTCAWIFTLPFTVFSFHAVSVVTIFCNFLILPAMPLLLGLSYAFSLICLIFPKTICISAASLVILPAKYVLFVSKLFSDIPWAYPPISPKDALILLVTLSAAVLTIAAIKKKKAALSFSLIFIIIIANLSPMAYNMLNKTYLVGFINVGQGECAIIRTPKGKNIMIDCGSESSDDAYEYDILPYITYRGIYKIDTLIISHWHSDHINAAYNLIADGKIKEIVIPDRKYFNDEIENAEEICETAKENNINLRKIRTGDHIKIDSNSHIDIISHKNDANENANENSLVLMLDIYGKKVLFASDIEANTQSVLNGKNIMADILKVPHHGGKSALSKSFAKAVSPKYSVISCAKYNRYRHPAFETMIAYSNSVIYKTYVDGTVEFYINKKGIKTKLSNER